MNRIDDIIVGLGETGRPLLEILSDTYDVFGYDIKSSNNLHAICDFLHICIPYQIEDFIGTVKKYQEKFEPRVTVIHSTVPIGTTSAIGNSVHSPILGTHKRMKEDMLEFPKWIGGHDAYITSIHFYEAGFKTIIVDTPEETEMLKLTCLAKYGMSIAFAQYQKNLCDFYGFDYNNVINWDMAYNNGVTPSLRRPILLPPGITIKGHCIIPGTMLLEKQHPNPILAEVLRYGQE